MAEDRHIRLHNSLGPFQFNQYHGERLEIDKLAAIRAVFDRFVKHCQLTRTPQYLTTDEKLETFYERCDFRQHDNT